MRYSDRLYKIYCRDGSYFPQWEESGEVYMSYAPAREDFFNALRQIEMWEERYSCLLVERPFGVIKPPFFLRSTKISMEFRFEVKK